MREPEAIVSARRELGCQLARCRSDAALTQLQLAELVAYSRTTVANVETGRQQAGRDFWERSTRNYGDSAGSSPRCWMIHESERSAS